MVLAAPSGADLRARRSGTYVPLRTPARMVDLATMTSTQTISPTFTDRFGLPEDGVLGVTAHVAVGSPTETGSVRAWAADKANPAVSTVLFQANVAWQSGDQAFEPLPTGHADDHG